MSFIKLSLDSHEHVTMIPMSHPLALDTKFISSVGSSTKLLRNRLVILRQNEIVQERLSKIETRPHMVAAAVSRYSTSQPVPFGTTPSTPPSPDEVDEPEDLLSLGRTVKRIKRESQKPNVVVRLIRNPESGPARLSSIKT
jgi:hypothetical protein